MSLKRVLLDTDILSALVQDPAFTMKAHAYLTEHHFRRIAGLHVENWRN